MSHKRPRANTNGDAAPASLPPPAAPQYNLSECIDTLDAADNGAVTKQILLSLAEKDSGLANLIFTHYTSHIQREQRKVLDFDHHSKDVWYKINQQYRSMSGSK